MKRRWIWAVFLITAYFAAETLSPFPAYIRYAFADLVSDGPTHNGLEGLRVNAARFSRHYSGPPTKDEIRKFFDANRDDLEVVVRDYLDAGKRRTHQPELDRSIFRREISVSANVVPLSLLDPDRVRFHLFPKNSWSEAPETWWSALSYRGVPTDANDPYRRLKPYERYCVGPDWKGEREEIISEGLQGPGRSNGRCCKLTGANPPLDGAWYACIGVEG